MDEVFFNDRSEWRQWLVENHQHSPGLWVIFYKKQSGRTSLNYADFVEEALCFGWIDSIIKKVDEDRFLRKVTPRRPNSIWSDLNKQRIRKLQKENRLAPAGLALIEIAKKSGKWDTKAKPETKPVTSTEFLTALNNNPRAKTTFESLAPSQQKNYLLWIHSAKRPETVKRRIEEAIRLLSKGLNLGLK